MQDLSDRLLQPQSSIRSDLKTIHPLALDTYDLFALEYVA